MDWKAKVDLFEQLRREHEFGVGTVAGVAAKFGVHRRMVRQALASALPPARHYPQRARPKLDAVASFIDRVLEEDLRAPRKQRHTARRLYRRLLTEFPGAALAESTVRNHVRERRHAMGLVRRETFVPQSYGLGQEAQARVEDVERKARARCQVSADRSEAAHQVLGVVQVQQGVGGDEHEVEGAAQVEVPHVAVHPFDRYSALVRLVASLGQHVP